MFKIYDKVWVMKNNRAVEKVVSTIIQSGDGSYTNIKTKYHLVDSFYNIGWGKNEGDVYSEHYVFPDKQSLIESL